MATFTFEVSKKSQQKELENVIKVRYKADSWEVFRKTGSFRHFPFQVFLAFRALINMEFNS